MREQPNISSWFYFPLIMFIAMIVIIMIPAVTVILRGQDIFIEVKAVPRYVPVNRTGEIKVVIHNLNLYLDTVLKLRVENVYGFLEIVKPVEELELKLPPFSSYELHIFVRGQTEGVEKIQIIAEAGDRSYVRDIEVTVTRGGIVYVNLYAGFYIGSLVIYRRPITADVRICPKVPSWLITDVKYFCNEFTYLGENKYYTEVALDEEVLYVAVIMKLPPLLPKEYYESIYKIRVRGDTVDILVPDIELNFTLLGISFIIFLIFILIPTIAESLKLDLELYLKDLSAWCEDLTVLYGVLLVLGSPLLLGIIFAFIDVFIEYFLGIYFFIIFVAIPLIPLLVALLVRVMNYLISKALAIIHAVRKRVEKGGECDMYIILLSLNLCLAIVLIILVLICL